MKRYRSWTGALLLALPLALLLAPASVLAQEQKAQPRPARPADVENAAYGPHERNVLDLYKAKSERPTPLVVFIHGGGFVGGDKRGVAVALLEACLENGISVASINYRYSTQAPYPGPMHDGARAVQFLRSKAREWNLNPKAFAASGGSAGAGMSLWIGFHDDMADGAGSDPVKRQSTRLSAMGVIGAQSSYDPRTIEKLIGLSAAKHPALETLYGLKGEELKTARAYRLFEDASPITHLSAGDPPVFMFYSEPNEPLPPDAKPGAGIHHPRFGFFLKERMDKLGIECQVRLREEYGGDRTPQMFRDMVAFFQKYFPK